MRSIAWPGLLLPYGYRLWSLARETGERTSLIIICRTLGLARLAKLISQIFEGSHKRRINIAQVARFVRILMKRAAPSGHHAYKLVSVLTFNNAALSALIVRYRYRLQ